MKTLRSDPDQKCSPLQVERGVLSRIRSQSFFGLGKRRLQPGHQQVGGVLEPLLQVLCLELPILLQQAPGQQAQRSKHDQRSQESGGREIPRGEPPPAKPLCHTGQL